MTREELLIALKCCSDKDFARCSRCPLLLLDGDACRRRVTAEALEYIQGLKKQG